MGPLKRIITTIHDIINQYDQVINNIDYDNIMLVSERRGLKQALDIVQAEYDKYYKPKCNQEQLELKLNFKK